MCITLYKQGLVKQTVQKESRGSTSTPSKVLGEVQQAEHEFMSHVCISVRNFRLLDQLLISELSVVYFIVLSFMQSFILFLIHSHIQDSQVSSDTKPSSHLIALTSSICSDARDQVTRSTVSSKRAPSLTRARLEAHEVARAVVLHSCCALKRGSEKKRGKLAASAS